MINQPEGLTKHIDIQCVSSGLNLTLKMNYFFTWTGRDIAFIFNRQTKLKKSNDFFGLTKNPNDYSSGF